MLDGCDGDSVSSLSLSADSVTSLSSSLWEVCVGTIGSGRRGSIVASLAGSGMRGSDEKNPTPLGGPRTEGALPSGGESKSMRLFTTAPSILCYGGNSVTR